MSIYRQVMSHWFQQPLGRCYLKGEHQQLHEILPKLFGYHLLILGEAEFANCTTESPIGHRILISSAGQQADKATNLHDQQTVSAVSNAYSSRLSTRVDKLPIGSESIDAVYLAHCLDVAKNPHEVLREAYRVLRPEGYLIISGFNPWSSWGFLRLLRRFRLIANKPPWHGRFMSALKLKDWLYLLGFEFLQTRNFCYYLPINDEKILQKMSRLEKFGQKFKLPFGAAYVLVACKRVITLTPIRPRWRTKPRILADDLVEPLSKSDELC